MDMPESVKVGPHVYTLTRLPKEEMPKTDGVPQSGECDYDSLSISIQKGPGIKRSKTQEWTMHELLHACGYPNLIEKKLTEEEFVDAIAPVLLQVIRDNPDLIAYLTSS